MEIPSYVPRTLYKQSVQVNFAQGLDTKTDPYQVHIGNFLTLVNSVFTTGGRLTKRNGFANITTLPNTNQTNLTTYNENLIATGSNLYTYNSEINSWYDKGTIQPVQLTAIPLVRTNASQSSPDLAIASNGLGCLVFTEAGQVYYQIVDTQTGETIITRQALPSSAVLPRVNILGNYFFITFYDIVASVNSLQGIAIPIQNPTTSTTITISSTISSLTTGYDAIIVADQLYVSWSLSGTAIGLAYVTSGLGVSPVTTVSSYTANLISMCADLTPISSSYPIIYISFWDGTNGHTMAYATTLVQVFAPVQTITSQTLNHIISTAQSGNCTVFYSVQNSYPTPMTGSSDYLEKYGVNQSGTITSAASTFLRSVDIASRAFVNDNTIFFLCAYTSQNQPSYFLSDSNGNIYMRLAYSNSGGYLATQVVPSVSSYNNDYYLPYQYVDFLATVNKTTSVPAPSQINAIYTQTGINLAKIGINNSIQYPASIAQALHLTGGQLWEYDGIKPVEHGFHVWPEGEGILASQTAGNIAPGTYFYVFTYEWTDNQGNLHRSDPSIPYEFVIETAPSSFTADLNSNTTLTNVSSFTGLQVGQPLRSTDLVTGTYITALNPTTAQITISQAATATASAQSIFPTSVSEVTCYVPTLRLTYKTGSNPVRIVGYRWSQAQPIYYQFTSLTSPITNSTTSDYITITDNVADSAITGNVVLYTTGGILGNIAAPASVHLTLFQDRLFLIDAEDQNLIWFSKQIIEATPVEMSDLLTIYIAPTLGAQGSTGSLTALFPMDDKLILFKKDAIYYITGAGPDNTGANNEFTDPIFITTSVGCDNPASIVLTPNGLMFQSDKGIWLLDRSLNTNYIGAAVENYNSQTVNSAALIPGTTQVRFILDNNITLMYDYYYNQWGTFNNILAISGTLYQGYHTYLNSKGQIFQEAPGTFTDGSTPVLMSFTTSWINTTGLRGFQRFYHFLMLGQYFSPFKLNLQIAYDYEQPTQSVLVTSNDYNTPNWGQDAVWGSNQDWGGPGNTFRARVFAKQQKCETFQISAQEIYDSSYSQPPGQGLSLSGLNLVIGVKKGYATQRSAKSFG